MITASLYWPNYGFTTYYLLSTSGVTKKKYGSGQLSTLPCLRDGRVQMKMQREDGNEPRGSPTHPAGNADCPEAPFRKQIPKACYYLH